MPRYRGKLPPRGRLSVNARPLYCPPDQPGSGQAGQRGEPVPMQSNPGRDLWVRMAALDKCCIVKLESFRARGDPTVTVLRWRASITQRGGKPAEPITVECE